MQIAGHNIKLILFFFLASAMTVQAQWDGGDGHGTAAGDDTAGCPLISIYTSSAGDGYDKDSLYSDCTGRIIYSKGGSGQGFTIDSVLNNCLPASIYKGDTADGFDHFYAIGCRIDTLIANYEVIRQKNCVTGDSAIARAFADTSNPEYMAVPPFTFTWYAGWSSGTQLRTITRPEYSDTLDKLPPGLYTVVITDDSSRVDSVNINIGECLYSGGAGKGYGYDTANQACPYDHVYTGSQGDGYTMDTMSNACADILTPYTRGGSGQGFTYDTTKATCMPSSINKGSTADGHDQAQSLSTCSFTYFSVGGSGHGFARDTALANCSVLQIYTGSQGDGHDEDSIVNTCRNYMVTVGGAGNGFARDTSKGVCQPVNIYTGSQGDGFDKDSIENDCFSGLATAGGSGQGFATDTFMQNCLAGVIVRGSEADGHDRAESIQNCDDQLPYSKGGAGSGFDRDTTTQNCMPATIFKGDTNDGFDQDVNISCMVDTLVIDLEVGRHVGCTPADDTLGIATLGIVEERPYWGSDGPYVIDWKEVASLDGFPTTTMAKSIQVDSLNEGTYTVVVIDTITGLSGGQRVLKDSVTFNINGCLYRGGSGDGDATDTAFRSCPLVNNYTGSEGDGYSHDTLFNTCDVILYTQGGTGNGFGRDTGLSTCTPENIYTGSQADGYSNDTIFNDCSGLSVTFKGGSGNGFSTDTARALCAPSSVFKGSTADGFDFYIDTSECNMPLMYKGGTGNGFARDTSRTSCEFPTIHKGSENDGADFMYNGCTPLIYDQADTRGSCVKAGEFVSSGTGEWEQIGLNGDIVIGINDNGNTVDTLEVWFYVNDGPVRQDPNGILEDYYLDRNFWIFPKNGFETYTTPVSLRLYFTNTEFINLRNEDPNVSTITDLQVTKYDGANDDCTLANDAATNNDTVYGFINDNPDESISHWVYENGYYVEFDVNYFHSEFFINYHEGGPIPNDPVSIDDFDDVCLDTTPITLNHGNPAGGTYSGPGVSGTTFDPAVAGVDTHYIKYEYTYPSSRTVIDSSSIIVHPLPSLYTVSITNDEMCEGDTGEGIHLSDSDVETLYNIYRDDTLTSAFRYGDNDSLSMGIFNTAGDYAILAIDTATGCDAWMNDTVSLTIHPTPAPNITGDNPVCAKTTGIYYIDGTAGNNFTWTLDSASLGNVTNLAPDSIAIDWQQVTTGQSTTTGLEIIETNPGTGCSGSDNITITIFRKPETGEYYYVPND